MVTDDRASHQITQDYFESKLRRSNFWSLKVVDVKEKTQLFHEC
jgi:hypothetical protein